MLKLQIKSKSYFPITTLIDGRTVKIPSKGKELKISTMKITEHLKELANKNLIQIIEK